eukprot:scaffold16956_cov90-Isochrysis_galbana.AAC.2
MTWKPRACLVACTTHSLIKAGVGTSTRHPDRRTPTEHKCSATPTSVAMAVRVLPAPTADASAKPRFPSAKPRRTRSRASRW